MLPNRLHTCIALLALACLLPASATSHGGSRPQLSADLPSGQLVGTTITWTVTPPDDLPRDHRFRIWHFGEGLTLIHDFDAVEIVEWTPVDEGLYFVRVDSRERDTAEIATVASAFWIQAPAEQAAVLPTAHPLVALYSGRIDTGRRLLRHRCSGWGRACQIRVVFQALGSDAVQTTHARPIQPHGATSLYVAGMRPQTQYALRHEILDRRGRHLASGPTLMYETGSVDFEFPESEVRIERSDPLTETDPVVLVTPILGEVNFPYATDLQGRPIWYDRNRDGATLTRAVEGGTFLEQVGLGNPNSLEVQREIDLAGHVLRRVTLAEVNRQLLEIGEDAISTFHHDARRLPDGRIAVIGLVIRELEDVQGPGPISILGDNIVVLDRQLRVEWVWNAFEKLDVTRPSVLGLSCVVGQGGCQGTRPGITSNDWTHSNALDYSPEDGALILSVRNQDWVVKIDYADGKGSGDVIWRLGNEGDFTLEPYEAGDPFPWFSHAHDPNLLTEGRLAVYDNGNTPCALGIRCESRGQVYEIDEQDMTARVVTQAELERNSFALGSAQELRGRDAYHFGTGLFPVSGSNGSTAEEVGPDGSIEYSLFQGTFAYRSFRMQDLYTPPPSVSESARRPLATPRGPLLGARLSRLFRRWKRMRGG